jgi:hypothetical protein
VQNYKLKNSIRSTTNESREAKLRSSESIRRSSEAKASSSEEPGFEARQTLKSSEAEDLRGYIIRS